jgi:hypothetical protein
MRLYHPPFPIGTEVRVANRASLEAFWASWHLEQPVPCLARPRWSLVVVTDAGFSHGEDTFHARDGIRSL